MADFYYFHRKSSRKSLNSSTNYDQFILSLENDLPPNGVTGLLVALWWERKDKWDKSQHYPENSY